MKPDDSKYLFKASILARQQTRFLVSVHSFWKPVPRRPATRSADKKALSKDRAESTE